MFKISGVYCAVLTPLNSNLSINSDLHLRHCQSLMQKGLDGLTIFGTNGEASSFSVTQKIKSIEFLLENRIDASNLLIGTGSASLEDAIELTKFSVKIGAKASLLIPAFYFKNVTDDGVIAYYRNVIEQTGDNNFKFLLYNIPQLSGVTINFNIIENLLKLYPNNIVGLKDSTGDMGNMLKMIKYFNDFAVFCGNGALALHTSRRGGAGAITGDANITAKLLSFIIHNFRNEKQIENFENLQVLMEKIRNVLTSHEQISLLKAYYSVADNIDEWNNVLPPLKRIDNPSNNKQVTALLDLVGQIDTLIPSSS
jgi:4-hydroxy-tetrahydrodipicolinate synthase